MIDSARPATPRQVTIHATTGASRAQAFRNELDKLRHLQAQRPLSAVEFRRMLDLARATGEALL